MKLRLLINLILPLMLFSCTKQEIADNKSSKVTIYFTKANDDLGVVLIPVVRNVSNNQSAYEVAIKELFLGPTISEQEHLELSTEIPQGVRLINVKESSEAIKIDISSQFKKGGGSETIQVRFRQLRETALSLAKGRPIYLYIDGVKAKTIGGEGLEVPQPMDSEV